jgi:glycosyltransferase involved in cell wall biosynthesis
LKISLLCPNVSTNALARTYVLARVLERRYEVEVAGPSFQGALWEPLATEDFEVIRIPLDSSPAQILGVRRLRRRITGDVIYACKPLLTSYGLGLALKLAEGRPLVLDVDDWEVGFNRQRLSDLAWPGKARYLASSALRLHVPQSYWNGVLFERLSFLADAATVSNGFLQRRFGGTVVWHGRDTDHMGPGRFGGAAFRRELGVKEDARLVLYLGTFHRYKGVEDLIRAVALLDRTDLTLVLVGATPRDLEGGMGALAQEVLGERARILGPRPFARVPEMLAAGDVVVIPQRRTPATVGQMPAKLFDAMAMARPVVSTAVSDIPEALGETGWVAEPGSPEDLAARIAEVLEDPAKAERMGNAARERCESLFSWNAMERVLAGVFDGLGRSGAEPPEGSPA